jgi:hypothetical protein
MNHFFKNISLILIVFTILSPIESSFFFKKKKKSIEATEVKNEKKDYEIDNLEEYISKSFDKMKSTIDSGIQKFRKKASVIKRKLLGKLKKGHSRNQNQEALKDFREFVKKEERRRKMMDKKKRTKPGVAAIISEGALNHLKNCFIPIVLSTFLSEPLAIEYEFGFITILNIYVDLFDINIDFLKLELDSGSNQLKLVFPTSPIKLILDTELNLGKKLRGNIMGHFVLEELIIKLEFVEDMKRQYFKPRILLSMNKVKLGHGGFNVKATFKHIPDKLLKMLLYLLNNKIKKLIVSYLTNTFIEESSDILNWVLDDYYPSNINFLKDDLRLNLDLTHAPEVESHDLMFYMVGEFFSTDYVSEEDFTPDPYPEPLKLPSLSMYNNMSISLTAMMIKTFLDTLFNDSLYDMPVSFSNYEKLTIDIYHSEFSISPNGIEIVNGKINFFEKRKEIDIKNPDYIKNVSLTLDLPYYDIERGILKVELLKVKFFDDNDNRLFQMTRCVMNAILQKVVSYLFSKEYEIYPIELNQGLEIDRIWFELHDGYVIAKSNLLFDPNENEFIESSKFRII